MDNTMDLLENYNEWTNFTQKSELYLDEPNNNLLISQVYFTRHKFSSKV